MKETYVYVMGFDEGKEPDQVAMTLVKKTKDETIIILEKQGDEARLWLDFFYKLHNGKAKVVVEKE